MQCKHCLREFFGGASRVRDHSIQSAPSCGVVKIFSLSATTPGCEQNWSSFELRAQQQLQPPDHQACHLVWLYSSLRLAKQTKSLEQQNMAQPWVALSQEVEEEEEEWSSSGGTSVMRIRI